MGAKETIESSKKSIEEAISNAEKSLEASAAEEKSFIEKNLGIADEFASKFMRDRALSLEIKKSDSPEVANLKRAMNASEQNRLAGVEKTSKTIQSVTAASSAVAGAIYPPAGVAVMVVGAVVNMAYKFYSSSPGADWANIAEKRWSAYAMTGLPRPMFPEGDKLRIQPYVKQWLEKGIGWNLQGFGTTADEYEAEYAKGIWAQSDGFGWHGGYLHTCPPDVFRALQEHSLALQKTKPGDIDNLNPLYQASPYLALQYQKFANLSFESTTTKKFVWYWYLDCNLWLCNERPVPLYVRNVKDMDAADPGETIPAHSKGISWLQLREGQNMIDALIRQVCITAAISQGVPVWASGSVIAAGQEAWAEYRKAILQVYYEVESQGRNGVTDKAIAEITGQTYEANINPERPGDKRFVNRGPNGIDAIGRVYRAAADRAMEIALSGLTLANTATMRPAWVEFAKKADFQFVSTVERNASKLELSPEAQRKLTIAKVQKAAESAIVIPVANPNFKISDIPQYVANKHGRSLGPLVEGTDWPLSTKVALGVGGVALLGGGGYYLHKKGYF